MRGFYFNKEDSFSSELGLSKDGLRLLAKQGNLEIMQQHIVKGAVVWLVPGESQDDLDFFYVHSGRIDIITDELNESFACLLYTSTRPWAKDSMFMAKGKRSSREIS